MTKKIIRFVVLEVSQELSIVFPRYIWKESLSDQYKLQLERLETIPLIFFPLLASFTTNEYKIKDSFSSAQKKVSKFQTVALM